MDNFYVHLQSDASWHHFSNNKRTNYRNHLAVPISIDSDRYEVALTELTYTYNDTYISKGTRLFQTFRAKSSESNDDPRQTVTRYPIVYFVSGDNQVSGTDVTSSKIVKYAKEKLVHLSFAKEVFELNNWDPGKNDTLMIKSRMDILAESDITTSEQLLAQLNKKLNDMQVYIDKVDDNVLISHKNPHLIVERDIDFAEVVTKHFQFGIEDENMYQSTAYVHNSVLSKEPLNIEKGTRLCTIGFYKGEIDISKQDIPVAKPLVDKNLLYAGFTTKNIYTLDELISVLSGINKKLLTITIENDRAKMVVNPPYDIRLELNERVFAILGFNINENFVFPKDVETRIEGIATPVFDVGARKVYVYTDCITSQRVGDQLAPLLRITDYTGEQGKLVIKDFNQLQYVKVNKDQIDSIRVYFKNEIGGDLPLIFGTSCTLHFREKRF